MGLLDRPYAPTWQQNRQVYRYTPDAIVYVNGSMSIDGCPMCNQRIELQKYITTISVDPTTDPVSSASVSLVVPKHASDVFGSDGNWILQPGLEIVILFRGYFSQTGLVDKAAPAQDAAQDAGLEPEGLQDVAMYPYYQVFRGVVKDVVHEFSGGFYSATLSCADILHFWQHLYLSTQGAVFGPRPDNSGVYVDLAGHSFTGLGPFSIIYTLVRAGFGAAFGVDYKLSQKTNFSDPKGLTYKHAAEYWAARWEENAGNLRMYGIDGSVFTDLEQAYLGVFQSGSKGRVSKLIKSLGVKLDLNTRDLENTKEFKETMRKLGYNRSETASSVTVNANGKIATVDMLAMMVYANDLGTLGSVNFFNSDMMSKLEIANAVTALTGYEFYQDVDGDLVFKPPFYNLDTSDDSYYVVEDLDLISISENSTEPEATMIKGTGSHFQNWKGTGTDDWMGVGATYVDFRLVAQFGWREGGAFETTYLTDPRSIFISAINRLDLANLGMHTANITIPMRPELRPGYPIYIKHLDCFYYIKGLSHSFTFGGQCTTSITGVARRRKWFPPIDKSGDGKFPTLSDIRLDEPGKYSAAPIFVDPKNVGDGTQISGPTRMIGFPNVILALDSGKLDVGSIPVPTLNLTAVDQIIGANQGVFTKAGDDAYTLRGSQGSSGPYSKEELLAAFNLIRDDAITPVYNAKNEKKKASSDALAALDPLLAQAFQNSPLGNNSALRNERELAAWVSLNVNLRSLFAPGNDIRGQYRYYSSNHGDIAFQGPKTLVFTDDSPPLHEEALGFGEDSTKALVPTLTEVENGVGLVMKAPLRGVRIAAYGSNSGVGWGDVRTGDVRQVAFSPHRNDISTTEEVLVDAQRYAKGFGIDKTKVTKAMTLLLEKMALKKQPDIPIAERFEAGYALLSEAFDNFYERIVGVIPGLAGMMLPGPKGSCLEELEAVPFGTAKDKIMILADALTALRIPGDAIVTVLTKYKSKDAKGVAAISAQLAAPYAILTTAFVGATKALMPDPATRGSEITTLYRAKVLFESNLGMRSEAPVGGGTTKSQKKKSSKTVYTPVFPVSDAGGYEVYGGMPYGRGMTLTGEYELFTGIGASAKPSLMYEKEKALVLLHALFGAKGDLAGLFEAMTSPQKAVLAAAGVHNPGDLSALKAKELLRKGQILARNKPLDTGDLDQAMSGANAALNLARINSNDSGACACKNADASFLLEAANRQFAPVTEHDVQDWVTEQVLQTGILWEQSKDAMAGVSSHSPTDYKEQSKAFLNSVQSQFNNGRDAISKKAKRDYKEASRKLDENGERISVALIGRKKDD